MNFYRDFLFPTLVVTATLFAACSTEESNIANTQQRTKIIKVVADVTRTEFNDDRTRLTWSENDTFAAFTDAGDINIQSSTYPNDFTLELSSEANEVYAYYPYYKGNDSKSATGLSVGINGNITQSKRGSITSSGLVPMVARGTIEGDELTLHFEPIACVIGFNIYGGTSNSEKVESIKFSANELSSGFDFNFDLTDPNKTYTPIYEYTLLKLTDDAQFVPNGTKPEVASQFENTAFMSVAKQVYTGATIVVTTSEATYTFSAKSDIKCDSNYTTLNLNLDKAVCEKHEIIEGPYASDSVFVCSIDNTNNASYSLGNTTIDGYKATGFKLGTSKKIGTFTSNMIGVSNAKYINFYAVAWRGTTATLSLTVDNGEAITIDIAGNSGAFDNPPYNNLVLTSSDYYSIELADLSASSKITFTTTQQARAILCGITLSDEPLSNPKTPVLKAATKDVALNADGGDGIIEITSRNLTEEITLINDSEDWILAELDADSNLYYVADANNSTEDSRTATITLSANGLSTTIKFTQEKKVVENEKEDDKYSYTFTKSQFSSNTTVDLGGLAWTLEGDGSYWGYDATKGQQFGSAKKPYMSLTLSTSDFNSGVQSITINTSGASSTTAQCNITVGGTTLGSTVSLLSTAMEYTFATEDNEPLYGEIVISYTQKSSKAIYIKSISIK